MDFVCLDGSIISVDVKPSKYPTRDVSKKQSQARERIVREFGDQIILEEFTIPKTRLRLDFFLPRAGVAVEVHGNQHFEFVKHFHGTKKKFLEAQQNDADKKHWCELNGIRLVIWSDNE